MNPIKTHSTRFKFINAVILSAFIYMLSATVLHFHIIDIGNNGISVDKDASDSIIINQLNSEVCYLIHYFTSNYNLDLSECENSLILESVVFLNNSNTVSFQNSIQNNLSLRGPPNAS